MALAPGARFGSYEIVGPIGAGGMGEVYRARDGRLGRDAAIKILPTAFLNDPDRVARFEREARTLASLNHPNIAQIYGMENLSTPMESAGSGQTCALVMELVEGEDLSQILARGPVALQDALPIARQIASALEAAHELGIVHRDLKPANVKVRADGTVKVLDFGLAKAGDPDVGRDLQVRLEAGLKPSPYGDSADSLTVLSPAMTGMGMILGTAAYMSPEQARGKVVDKRADVWAFGVVLYEMLSGRRAFEGGEVSDVLAAVLKDTVPLQQVPAGTPPSIRRLLRRCLEKDRAERLDSMAAARLEIADAIAAKSDDAVPGAAAVRPAGGSRALLTTAAAIIAAAALTGFVVWRAMLPAARPPVSFTLSSPGGELIQINPNQPDLAISPDGRRIAYSHGQIGGTMILRTVDQFGDTALTGLGEQPRSPFFSPDGMWLGYLSASGNSAGARLMKLPLDGGAPVEIAAITGNLRGAAWGRDNSIIFGTSLTGSGLWRVAAGATTPEMLTTPNAASDEIDHLWPSVLPDGKHVVFTVLRRMKDLGKASVDVAVLDLATRAWRTIKSGASYPRFVSTGHLLYVTEQGLFAAAFDPVACEFRGEATRMIEDVAIKVATGAADFDVSDEGTLAYIAGARGLMSLAWVEGRATVIPIVSPPRAYTDAVLSPDEKRVAVTLVDGVPALWVLDIARGVLTPLSPPGHIALNVLWSGDSRHIYYRGSVGAKGGVVRVSASGAGAPELIFEAAQGDMVDPSSLTLDGRALFVTRSETDGRVSIQLLNLEGTPSLKPVLTDDRVGNAQLSPDGRWIAYTSRQNIQQPEVFLRPYPNVSDDRIQVTTNGGSDPIWARDGRAIYFTGAGRDIWSVEVMAGGRLGRPVQVTKPDSALTQASDHATGRNRVIRIQPVANAGKGTELRVVLNWFELLKQKARVP